MQLLNIAIGALVPCRTTQEASFGCEFLELLLKIIVA